MGELIWQSDWNGDEVGYPEVSVVGLYSQADGSASFYINMETNEVLEILEPDEV